MSYRLSADIGGTFTDVVRIDEETGEYISTKVLTTNDLLTKGVLPGFDSVVNGDYWQKGKQHCTWYNIRTECGYREERGSKVCPDHNQRVPRCILYRKRKPSGKIYNNHYTETWFLLSREEKIFMNWMKESPGTGLYYSPWMKTV